MAKRQRRVQFDATGERLLALGLSYSSTTGWYAEGLELQCLPNPVVVTCDGGSSGVHPLQLEAVERLVAEVTPAVFDLVLRAVHDDLTGWYRAHGAGRRAPSRRWVRANAAVGEVFFPAPRKRGPERPHFGLFATRSSEDSHPLDVFFAWGEAGWELIKHAEPGAAPDTAIRSAL